MTVKDVSKTKILTPGLRRGKQGDKQNFKDVEYDLMMRTKRRVLYGKAIRVNQQRRC